MMELKELFKQYMRLGRHIKDLLNDSGYLDYDEFTKVDFQRHSVDDLFLLERLSLISEKLSDALYELEYLKKPVLGEFTLYKDERNYYACSERQYHCGYRIEYLAPNSDYDPDDPDWSPCAFLWRVSRVEHDGNRYYIVNDRDVCLDGLTVRVRGS